MSEKFFLKYIDFNHLPSKVGLFNKVRIQIVELEKVQGKKILIPSKVGFLTPLCNKKHGSL